MTLTAWKKSYDQPIQLIKKQRHYFPKNGPSSQDYVFSGSHVWIWELDYRESWAPKNWCFWTVVLQTLENPLDCKKMQSVHPKRDQSWMFIGRTDVESETPIIWPHDAKSWLIWNNPDAGKDWRWEQKGQQRIRWLDGITLNGHEFAWTLGVGNGQGALACCGLWGRKKSNTTERLNWTESRHNF